MKIIDSLRWGIHLGTATWVFGAIPSQQGASRWISFMVAFMFGPVMNIEGIPESIGIILRVLQGVALEALRYTLKSDMPEETAAAA